MCLCVRVGVDNYFSEAFPQIFFNRLRPVFDRIGINLTVRNHALGNNPCYAYDACIATHVGDDVDIVVWEQVRHCHCHSMKYTQKHICSYTLNTCVDGGRTVLLFFLIIYPIILYIYVCVVNRV